MLESRHCPCRASTGVGGPGAGHRPPPPHSFEPSSGTGLRTPLLEQTVVGCQLTLAGLEHLPFELAGLAARKPTDASGVGADEGVTLRALHGPGVGAAVTPEALVVH